MFIRLRFGSRQKNV